MYVRHRSRMVRQSVIADLRRLLTELQWVEDPNDPFSTTLGILEGRDLRVIEYFPTDFLEGKESLDPNVMAINVGNSSPPYQYELGGMRAQDYQFQLMLLAVTDGMAQALLQDLSDRYMGEVEAGRITLYNWAAATPQSVVDMEVESFSYSNAGSQVASVWPTYFATLVLTDYLQPEGY